MFDLERVTAELQRELGAVREERPGVRHAGLVTQLRLAGEVGVRDGTTTIRAELDSPAPALRMRSELGALHGRGGLRAEVVTGGGGPCATRCGSRRPGPIWPGRRGWSTGPDGRCSGCHRPSSRRGPPWPPGSGVGR